MAITSHPLPGDQPATRELPPKLASSRRHRRPSGEPPPLPRQLNRTSRYWLGLTLTLLAVFLVGAAVMPWLAITITVIDHHVIENLAGARTTPLVSVARGVGWVASSGALQAIWLVNLVLMLFFRRWRHLFVWVATLLAVIAVVGFFAAVLGRPRPLGVRILGPWNGFSMPSLPVAALSAVLVSTLYSQVPQGRRRQVGKWLATAVVFLVGLSRVFLAQDHPSDVLVGVVIGVTFPLVAFRLLVPNDIFPVTYGRGRKAHLDVSGRRSEAICRALADQLGVLATEVKPFGLEGSGGSTPLRVRIKAETDSWLFCKLYAATHLRSDRWYKLGRTLLYGQLEDEKAFNSVRRLVQYEDYALRLLHAAELPVPTPYGIVEITPEREYLVVMEFFDGAREIGDPEVVVDEAIINQGMLVIRRLWEAGLAHRDVKPANLLVRDGRLLLIDSAFAEVRPSPWRQAVDLANMMLVLALRSDVQTVYLRAQHYFTVEEITEAFAATRGLTMPSQLRHLMRAQGRDLHAEFKRLLPERVRPIVIQRWSFRRAALSLCVLAAGIAAIAVAVPLVVNGPL